MFKWLKARRERRERFMRDFMERSQFANFVPGVSANDVLRLIHRDFSAAIHNDVLASLNRYGTETFHSENHRVHAAILKLSNGNRDRIDHFVQIAMRDFRDVLMLAELPSYFTLMDELGMRDFAKRPIEEIKALAQNDRDQYLEWLSRENRPSISELNN